MRKLKKLKKELPERIRDYSTVTLPIESRTVCSHLPKPHDLRDTGSRHRKVLPSYKKQF